MAGFHLAQRRRLEHAAAGLRHDHVTVFRGSSQTVQTHIRLTVYLPYINSNFALSIPRHTTMHAVTNWLYHVVYTSRFALDSVSPCEGFVSPCCLHE